MKYEIKGETLPVVECYLESGESLIVENGAMSWMSPNMEMETSGGGLGKMFGRAFSGEAMFQNTYTAKNGPGLFAMSSSFPGSIIAFDVSGGNDIILQKKGFLGCEKGVELSVFFQKKLGAGLFGGEGFIMQRCAGNGIVFGEFDGAVIERVLAPGEQLVIDTGYLAAMEGTVKMDIQQVKGLKNKLLGGEGFFNTIVTGPGKIYLQTMPLNSVAGSLAPYIVTNNN